MLGFLEASHPETAIQVWDHMVKAGYEMRVHTYTAVMRGAQFSRDATGLQNFWLKMRKAGIRPDHQAWTTRIFGLLRMKKTQAGLVALSEMGREWHAAAHEQDMRERRSSRNSANTPNLTLAQLAVKYPGDVNGVPRPNCAVMNSAISALASTRDNEIGKVVAWGRTFGIQPDLITYNALMHIAMKHHQPEDAMKILQRMQERGIEPDATTWTVLISALFHGGFLDGLDAAAQEQKIMERLDIILSGSADASLNIKAYALIIDRLLKVHANPSAASAVLNRMLDEGLKPNPHIYTILMAHYFDSQPPNLAAIESLWARMDASSNADTAPMDSIFFDRMIEGYARLHREVGTQPMLDFLRRSQYLGYKPGWLAQECVARALTERGEWARLKGLVEDVRARLRTSRGATQTHGQADFWDFVISTGVLAEEGITHRAQLMPLQARESPLVRERA
jgi:pentatricopeptide repeat protein